jgi:probable lipoprotein NlpC
MIPAWVGPFVGIPYADKGRNRSGVDCWGLIRLALLETFGVVLPSYADDYTTADDGDSVSAAVGQGLADGWHRVEVPQCGDLIVLRIAGRPWHCALAVTPRLFLHAPSKDRAGRPILSCIDRLDSPMWARRISGIYRHIGVDSRLKSWRADNA